MSHPIPDDILVDHLAVLAKTGAGKTYLAKGIVERLLHKKSRVCIIDPKNAWWGLKSSADGKSPAFPIIVFGGPNADVPLLPEHGKVLGEAVATTDMACIICTKGMPEAQRIRFLTDFFQTLDMKNSEPLHLVLDEAHMMAPQKPLGEMQRLTHWTSELVSGGRGMGFRIILLSQRPARLNKDVLTQCESLVAMRMTGPQDRDAVKNWIHDQADMDKGKEIIASLPGLPNGTGWFWAPTRGILKQVKFPLIETYDNSKTKRDSHADAKATLAPVDLSALQTRLGKVKAEMDANDPGALRRQIAELRKQMAEAVTNHLRPTAAPAADLTHERSVAYNAGWTAAMKERDRADKPRAGKIKGFVEVIGRVEQSVAALLPKIQTVLIEGRDLIEAKEAVPVHMTVTPPLSTMKPATASAVTRMATAAVAQVRRDPPEGLTGRHQRILDGVAWWRAGGIDEPSRAQVGGAAGYAPGNGNFNNLVGALKTAGLVEYPTPGTVRLTPQGAAQAAPQDAPTTEELHARARAILSGRHVKILDVALAAYPESLSRDDLAAGSGYAPGNGNFNNLVGKLKTLEFITYPQPGSVRAAD